MENTITPPVETPAATEPSLFDNLAARLAEQQKVENTIEPPKEEAPKEEVPPAQKPIENEAQLNAELAKEVAAANLPKEEEAPAPTPIKVDIFTAPKTEEATIDYKAEHEKIQRALAERDSEEDDFVKEYKNLRKSPDFDFEKFVRDYVTEDHSGLSLEEKYTKFLKQDGLNEEQIKVEIDKLEDMPYASKKTLEKEIEASLKSSSAPKKQYAESIKAQVEDMKAQEEHFNKINQKAYEDLQKMSRDAVGAEIAGLKLDEAKVNKAVEALNNPQYHFNQDGTYNIAQMLTEKIFYQNREEIINTAVSNAVTEARTKWMNDRSNPSIVPGKAIAHNVDSDPLKTGLNEFLSS